MIRAGMIGAGRFFMGLIVAGIVMTGALHLLHAGRGLFTPAHGQNVTGPECYRMTETAPPCPKHSKRVEVKCWQVQGPESCVPPLHHAAPRFCVDMTGGDRC